MNQTTMFAFYVQGKQPKLIVSETMQPIGKEHDVKGRREARALAAKLGAKPWNF